MAEEFQKEMEKRKSNRRAFVQKLGLTGLAAGVASALVPARLEADPTTPTDTDILNFALNLEFLEAEFYTVATTGLTINQFGIIYYGTGTTGGTTTGGAQVTFTDNFTRQIAEELAAGERAHVALLQNALAGMGGSIAKPAINLNALTFGFGSQTEFLQLARIFEDLGVSAYGGAAGLISSKTVLGDAARILAVEAEHVGAIRLLIAQQGVATTPPLDGADVPPPPTGNQYFSTDSNALTQTRTPGQVLYVAYGGKANATSGGFFPAGVNGNLVTSSGATATTDTASLAASPNPIPVAVGAQYGATVIGWSAPMASTVEIHIGSPDGPLFAMGGSSGSMAADTVTDGMIFYLQNTSNGMLLIPQNTLATLIVHFQ